jgi:hypothetical protein
MNKSQEFIQLMQECSNVIQQYLNHPIHAPRYEGMVSFLDQMTKGVEKGVFVKDYVTLPIMQMLDQNDPEDMIESVKAVFAFYRDNYQLPW